MHASIPDKENETSLTSVTHASMQILDPVRSRETIMSVDLLLATHETATRTHDTDCCLPFFLIWPAS